MKPEVQIIGQNIEKQPAIIGSSVENVPKLDQEIMFKNGAERYEQKSESTATLADVGITTALPTPVKNIVADDKNTTSTDGTISINSPAVANDDDLIEKEWVDKAKKIVSETRDDPRRQEEAVSRLQVDYLKKRYGREIGVVK